jgi:hypothetical protein
VSKCTFYSKRIESSDITDEIRYRYRSDYQIVYFPRIKMPFTDTDKEKEIWISYLLTKDLLEAKLEERKTYCFFIKRDSGHKILPIEEWKVILHSIEDRCLYSYRLDEMVGREEELCNKIFLKLLFT